MGCLYQTPPFKAQGSMPKRRRKEKELEVAADSKKTASSRHQMIDRYMISQRLWHHAQDFRMFIADKNKSTEKGKWTQSLSTPRQEVICNWDLLLEKKKTVFSNTKQIICVLGSSVIFIFSPTVHFSFAGT